MKYCFLCLVFVLWSCKEQHRSIKQAEYKYIDLSLFQDGIHHWNLYSPIKSEKRLDTTNIIGIANNLIAYQNSDGGWPKNIDWLTDIAKDSVLGSLSERYKQSTFDNRNIFPQIAYLSATFKQTQQEIYKDAALKGFQYILNTEYSTGGWRGWDANVITFNDDVMTGIMNLLLDVKQLNPNYDWLDNNTRETLIQAYQRGLKAILKCQITVNNTLTAWCQQHDFNTYLPVQGRAYEHPAITARESCDVILFLMRINHPDTEVVYAIKSGVKWLDKVKIEGYRYGNFKIAERAYHETRINFDREFVKDSTAPVVWARYYDLKDEKPFLSLKNGTIVYKLSDISFDRRVGYEWYGFWPNDVFTSYAKWKKQHNY